MKLNEHILSIVVHIYIFKLLTNFICIFQVQYTGGTCNETNTGYYIAFGSIFATLCVGAFIQLVSIVYLI